MKIKKKEIVDDLTISVIDAVIKQLKKVNKSYQEKVSDKIKKK